MTTRTAFERDVLERVAAEYRVEGFRVVIAPGARDLPHELADFRPDMIAVSDEESVVVEIKIGADSRSLDQLDEMTRTAQEIGWRVDFVAEPREGRRDWDRMKRRSLLDQATALTEIGQLEAAVLVGWAATEASLRAIARHRRLPMDDRLSTRAVVDAVYSHGLIGDGSRNVLLTLVEARNGIAHGKSVERLSTSRVEGALGLGRWLNSDIYASPDEMRDWFFENFEDPVNWVFYDSQEGGYQYPPDEPHDAAEALAEHFTEATEDAIEDAAVLIESEGGPDWVRIRQ